MRFVENVKHIRRLMSNDMTAHAGDIAVLKMDSVGMRAFPDKQTSLAHISDPAPVWDPAELTKLPPESFGYAVGTFLSSNGLKPLTLTNEVSPELRRRNVYGIRVAATHDLVHVLTGFDTSWPGEMGVYAFQYGQRWSRWSRPLIVATWIFYPLLNKGRLGSLRNAYRKGLSQGQLAPFLLSEPLEDRFDEPLEELRAEFGIVV